MITNNIFSSTAVLHGLSYICIIFDFIFSWAKKMYRKNKVKTFWKYDIFS